MAVALLCGLPSGMFAQHQHGYRNGGGSREELSGLTCSNGSLTGAGTDACTVTLTEAASGDGFMVNLASSSSAVKVPASVTVVSGATSARFTATASTVSSAQTATLTASDSNNSESYSLQLKPAATTTGTPALTVGSASVAFGSVSLNTPATQTVKLTSSGTASVTISAATIKGTGFTMSGVTAPLTLTAGETATLDLQFDPTAAGADTGTVTISSNSSSGATSTIALSGTGTSSTAYAVDLSWDSPASSSDAVTGYNIYRASSGGEYELLNKSVNAPTTYTDTTVQAGASYTYEVMSVDSSGVQSAPSNVFSATVP